MTTDSLRKTDGPILPNSSSLSKQMSIGSQVYEDDFTDLEKSGVKLIICNRPDNEEMGQPSFMQISKWAQAHQMNAVHIPLQGGALSEELIDQTSEALNASEGKVLAYCKTGMRCALLWSFAKAPELGIETVLNQSQKAGFALAQFSPMLESYCAQKLANE